MAFRPEISGLISSEKFYETATEPRTETHLIVENHSQWPAINIVARYDSGDGWMIEERFDRIEGGRPPAGKGHRENPAVTKRLIENPTVPRSPLEDPEWQGELTTISVMTIEYEDERGLVRWRWSQERESSVGRKGSMESSGGGPRAVALTKLT